MARTRTIRTSRKSAAATRKTRARPARRPGAGTTKAGPAQVAPDAALQGFLEHYCRCLTAGDGQGAAACFEVPAFMAMAESRHGPSVVLDDPAKVADFFAQAPQQYNARGIATTFPDVRSVQWVAPALALVHVRFPYLDAHGNDLGDGETSLYLVRRGDDRYLITCAIALGTDADRADAVQAQALAV